MDFGSAAIFCGSSGILVGSSDSRNEFVFLLGETDDIFVTHGASRGNDSDHYFKWLKTTICICLSPFSMA